MENKNIYLDNHASTLIDKRVFKIMEPFLKKDFGNPHSESHTHGWIANKYIEFSRKKIGSIGIPIDGGEFYIEDEKKNILENISG